MVAGSEAPIHIDVHGTPDRRTVLSGGSAAALGIGSFLLPSAAMAASPGTSGAGVFGQLGTDITAATTGLAAGATLRRSFAHGGKRYFLDTTNYTLFQFSSAGSWEQTVTISNPPSGQEAAQPSSFLVHGDAAYLAMTRNVDVSGTPTPHLSVLRLALPLAPDGNGAVAVTYRDLDLNTAGIWGSRAIGGTTYLNVRSSNPGISALTVDANGVLHCVMNSRSDQLDGQRGYFMDFFDIPADLSSDPAPTLLYAATAVWPVGVARGNAVTVGGYSIFFDESQDRYPNPNPALRVPAVPGDWDLLTIPLPTGYHSLDIYNNDDRTIVAAGGSLWALADYYLTDFTAQGAAVVQLDIGAASVTSASSASLPIGTVVQVPSSKWSMDGMATDGTHVYAGFMSSTNEHSVARILATGTGAPAFDASVVVADTNTMQGMDSGVLLGSTTGNFIRLGNVAS